MTCKELIIERLKLYKDQWLTPEEMIIPGYSINNVCTRLSELARQGYIQGRVRNGKNYKEWRFVKDLACKESKTEQIEESSFKQQTQCLNEISRVECQNFKQLELI